MEQSTHHAGHRRRLRERFLKTGLHGFADHEIVELILTLAIPRCDVKPAAHELLNRFKSIRVLLDAPIDEISRIKGIGDVAATALKIIREVATVYLKETAESKNFLRSTDDIIRFWRMRIGAARNEIFEVAFLDSSFALIRDGIITLEEGTIDRVVVYPRRVMESAIRCGAYAIVCAHNHPSGSMKPSEQDKLLTRALSLAASTLQISFIDHMIVSADSYYSFREAGLL